MPARPARRSLERTTGLRAVAAQLMIRSGPTGPSSQAGPGSCASRYDFSMRTYTAVIERCPETDLFVGYVPGFPGAHSQAETLDDLNTNLREVIEMLLEDGEPTLETEFVGTSLLKVG